MSIHKGELKGETILAKYVDCRKYLQQVLKSPIAYHSLKNIHTSLDYLIFFRKNVFVMIIQLGPPTFFVTFTSLEHIWTLLRHAIQENRNISIPTHEENIAENNIGSLLRVHPVRWMVFF